MGEPVLEALIVENKMVEESVAHVPRLEQSVSFGRFEHDDSLCWERWSTFPSNKYLEEVEKCSTPGSVAEKKAYFEAHYKKISAQKLNLIDQEKMRESEPLNSDDHSQAQEVKDVHVDIINGEEVQHQEMVNFNEDIDFGKEDKLGLVSQPEDGVADLCHEEESCEFGGNSEEPVLAKEEDELVSEDKEELPQDKVEERKMIKKATQDVKLRSLRKTHKVAPTKKTPNSTNAIRKPVPQMSRISSETKPRSPISSTLKLSNSGLSKTRMSTTRTPVKKENGFTTATAKATSRPENKRVLPTSLHMSLSLGPSNSDPARKSLITERMGDKDVVKRAFKSFQSVPQRSSVSNPVKAPSTTQSPIRKIEQKGSATSIVGKKSEGYDVFSWITRAEKASNPETSQQTTRKTSGSPGLRKNTAVTDQKNSKPVLISMSSRSQDRGNKQKEVSKILDRKSKAKQPGIGMIQLQANVKVGKGANNIKAPGQTKLSSSYSQGHGFLKRLHKGEAMTASVGA